MSTIFDIWHKAAEQRARDYYAACVARSQARRASGGPSLAELIAAYQSLVPVESGPPADQLSDDELMLAVKAEMEAEDALVDAINEELFARGTLEECVEQQMNRMLSNARLQLITFPLPLN